MKKVLLFLSVSLILFSCGDKKVKKEIVPEKKIEKVVIPEVKKETPKPILIFTVQIGAFKKQNSKFSSIENVNISTENNIYKYRLGTFSTYKEARNSRRKLLDIYPGAFVQAVKNGRGIKIKEALK